MKDSIKDYVLQLLNAAGIGVNGDKPWDIQIYNPNFYQRVFKGRSLGLGEAYLDTWWDCQRLDQFFERLSKAGIEKKVKSSPIMLLKLALFRFINFQTKKRALEVGRKHYDLGNELFKAMLDSRMNYTCGYWRKAKNLEDAQRDKLDLVCQKLMLKPNLRVLDIGCGFGAWARFAAEHYGVSVVGITISKEQAEYARQYCAGLPIEIRFQDYREVNEPFDRIVSLGMFEHVGHLNYSTYMKRVQACLKDEGIFLLHTIGNNQSYLNTDAWIRKYIFPNGLIPSIAQIAKATEGVFVMEDWHNFGADYDKTLMAWQANFQDHWHHIKNNYDERFYRMWNYYLLSCAGVFRARNLQLWQIVFSKQGVEGGYQAPRLKVYKQELITNV